jgi:hypothetical protein
VATSEELDKPASDERGDDPPECVACRNRMTFVTAILDTRNSGRVRLFECAKCQNTAFIRE